MAYHSLTNDHKVPRTMICVWYMYSALLLDLPVASSLLFEAVKKVEKKCKGSRRESFFFHRRGRSREGDAFCRFFSPRTDIEPHLHSYWHWHSHLSIDFGTCSFSCSSCDSPQIELYWHQCWNRCTCEGKREGWCKVVQWAQLKRVIRAVRREPVQQLGLRRPSLSMSLKSTWYNLISLGITWYNWVRLCTAWNR